MTDELSIQKDLTINKYSLDEQWLKQPLLVYNYSKLLAEARQELSHLELELDVIHADLDKEGRVPETDKERKEGKKESQIKQWIVRQPEYQSMVKKVAQAKYKVHMLEGVIKALDFQKKALADMVQLYLSNYYSEPYNPLKGEIVQDKILDGLEQNPRLRRRREE